MTTLKQAHPFRKMTYDELFQSDTYKSTFNSLVAEKEKMYAHGYSKRDPFIKLRELDLLYPQIFAVLFVSIKNKDCSLPVSLRSYVESFIYDVIKRLPKEEKL